MDTNVSLYITLVLLEFNISARNIDKNIINVALINNSLLFIG